MDEFLFEKIATPTAEQIAGLLGDAGTYWEGIKEHLARNHPGIEEEWAWSGKKHGWSLRLKQKKRAILYMKPGPGEVLVGCVIGGKAVQMAREADPPAWLLELFDSAQKFPEGFAMRVMVRASEDFDKVERLVELKLSY